MWSNAFWIKLKGVVNETSITCEYDGVLALFHIKFKIKANLDLLGAKSQITGGSLHLSRQLFFLTN